MGYSRLELNGKSAVVIGGTSGIGLAIAVGLAEAGADVVASSRCQGRVDATAATLERMGRRTLRVACDVADQDSLAHLRDSSVQMFGKVDILVDSAGVIKRAPTLDFAQREWDDILNTNLTGTLRACQVFARHMLGRSYGRIINVASLTSFVGFHEVAAYGASKAAVMALTRSLAVEWAASGICVNALVPGILLTKLNQQLLTGTARGQELLLRTPMKRFGQVEEVVGAAVFLASDAASFVTGSAIVVDGGFLASGVNQ